jgi:hypothetical protein
MGFQPMSSNREHGLDTRATNDASVTSTSSGLPDRGRERRVRIAPGIPDAPRPKEQARLVWFLRFVRLLSAGHEDRFAHAIHPHRNARPAEVSEKLALPDCVSVEFSNEPIRGEELSMSQSGGGYNCSIGGIGMVPRQPQIFQPDRFIHGHDFKDIGLCQAGDKVFNRQSDLKFALLDFDSDFPNRDRADQAAVDFHLAADPRGALGKLGGIEAPPEQGAGVQENHLIQSSGHSSVVGWLMSP